MDNEAKISLNLSQFFFPQQERIVAKWDDNSWSSIHGLKEILDKALNPSLAFVLAIDKNNGVFMDKKRVKSADLNQCTENTSYSLSAKETNQFEFATCSGKNGYESSYFDFDKILNSFHSSQIKNQITSVFYPSFELSWPQRGLLTAKALQEFSFSKQSIVFLKAYASLAYPKDYSLFNGKCFMEPWAPQCLQDPYEGKLNRATTDGANAQLLGCYSEMATKCLHSADLAPVCIANGVVEIKTSLFLGQPAKTCPLVNKEIEAFSEVLRGKAWSDLLQNSENEAILRKKLF